MSKSVDFILSHLHLVPHWGGPSSNFSKIFGVRKLESWAIGRHCLHHPMFIRFSRTPISDRQREPDTHRQTQGHKEHCAKHSSCGKNMSAPGKVMSKSTVAALFDSQWSSMGQWLRLWTTACNYRKKLSEDRERESAVGGGSTLLACASYNTHTLATKYNKL